MNKKTLNILIAKYKAHSYIIRFIIVGIINTFVDFSVFTIANRLFHISYFISQVFGYSSGVINSFILNKIWTFNNKHARKKAVLQFSQFVFVNILSLSGSLTGLKFFVEVLRMNVYIAKAFATLFAQVLNFTGYKFWVFAKKEKLSLYNN